MGRACGANGPEILFEISQQAGQTQDPVLPLGLVPEFQGFDSGPAPGAFTPTEASGD
jgi:hypothetical protein